MSNNKHRETRFIVTKRELQNEVSSTVEGRHYDLESTGKINNWLTTQKLPSASLLRLHRRNYKQKKMFIYVI